MEKSVLVVGYNRENYNKIEREWLKYGIQVHMETDISKVIFELSNHNHYILIDIFAQDTEYLSYLKIIRELTNVSILIVRFGYDGLERVSAIKAGANEYIPWTDSVEESIAVGCELIRHKKIISQEIEPFTLLTCGDILLCVEYHKGYVCGTEINLTRQEFDFLSLLLRGIGRVFTYDQIYDHIWGLESESRGSGALWNLVSRLRAKIIGIGGNDKILQTVRNVGYRIDKVKTA